jgi:hypothetical protein
MPVIGYSEGEGKEREESEMKRKMETSGFNGRQSACMIANNYTVIAQSLHSQRAKVKGMLLPTGKIHPFADIKDPPTSKTVAPSEVE